MIQLAICDDESTERNRVKDALSSYFREHPDISAEIHEFSSAFDFLDALDNNALFDIVFLDIYMPGINGIEAAKTLRARTDTSKIIFLTSSTDHALDAFSVNAVHYLVKPFSHSAFNEALNRAFDAFKNSSKKLAITGEMGAVSFVSIDDIIYIESIGRKRYVYTQKKEFVEVKRTLLHFSEELEELAPGQFISPYRGYIINLDEVRTIEPNKIIMENGKQIITKTGDYRKLKSLLFNYSFVKYGGVNESLKNCSFDECLHLSVSRRLHVHHL
ncbi:MAG: response regulator transcription factor [Treponema sp.]|nr:response regulator transcription factor [Treponema sp.]